MRLSDREERVFEEIEASERGARSDHAIAAMCRSGAFLAVGMAVVGWLRLAAPSVALPVFTAVLAGTLLVARAGSGSESRLRVRTRRLARVRGEGEQVDR